MGATQSSHDGGEASSDLEADGGATFFGSSSSSSNSHDSDSDEQHLESVSPPLDIPSSPISISVAPSVTAPLPSSHGSISKDSSSSSMSNSSSNSSSSSSGGGGGSGSGDNGGGHRSGDGDGGGDEEPREEADLEDLDENGEPISECPICRYMRKGPCGKEFLAFDNTCVKRPDREAPMPAECMDLFGAMRSCYLEHDYYYGPILEMFERKPADEEEDHDDGSSSTNTNDDKGGDRDGEVPKSQDRSIDQLSHSPSSSPQSPTKSTDSDTL